MKTETAETTPGPTPLETLLGTGKFIVRYRNPAPGTPATEEVNITQLDLEHIEQVITLLAFPAALAELYCERPAGWARTLTLKSLRDLLAEGDRINADFFDLARMTISRIDQLKPGALGQVGRAALPRG